MRLLPLLLSACGGSLSYYEEPKGQKGNPDDVPTDTTPVTTPVIDTGSSTTTTGPTSTTTGTTSTTTTVPWTNGDPLSPPTYSDPPVLVRTGVVCADIGIAVSVDDDDDEITVESHDDNLEVRDLTSPVQGWFDLYDVSFANSGFSETNEHATLRIRSVPHPDGLPVLGNCAADWVVLDPDNYSAPGQDLFYLGTFWFDAGDNTLDVEHFCPRIRSGSCPEFEDLADPASTCFSGDDNSVHVNTLKLCLVAPTPS